MRKKLIAANWKMFKTPDETFAFMQSFLREVAGHNRDEIVICPPFVDLPTAVQAARHSNVQIGGQDMHWEKEGAYTGEISAAMLLAAGCTHVIIGHSERRQYFGETDDTVNRKLIVALGAGLAPIVCVGEVLQEREAGLTEDVLRRQCARALRTIAGNKAGPLVIAYEPVWAIGTGLTATPDQAQAVHHFIRSLLREFLGPVAEAIRIQYGGSVTPDNAATLLAQPDIDGALVGGASLKPELFLPIINAAG
jgi:triosephosphate isomerase